MFAKRSAETMALQAVAFLFEDPVSTERFLQESGITPDELKAGLNEPAMLSAICAFLLGQDAQILDFCRRYGYRPEDVHAARHLLDEDGSGGR